MRKLLEKPLCRYTIPIIIFAILTEIENLFSSNLIFLIYGIKICLVGVTLAFFLRGRRKEIPGSFEWKAVLIGLFVFVIWVGPGLFIEGSSIPKFNPEHFNSFYLKSLAILVRVFGAVLIIPLMEELFWRSFLMRIFIRKNFMRVPLGTYHHFSFWMTALAFMFAHRQSEWLVAFIAAVIYGAYLIRSKNLWSCIVAHATTNLALSIYIIYFERWEFW